MLSVSVSISKYVSLLVHQVVYSSVIGECLKTCKSKKMILQVYYLAAIKSWNYKTKLINQLITVFSEKCHRIRAQFLLNWKNVILIVYV